MRLIDADALIQDLKDYNIPFNADINEAIIVAPTVDPYKHGHWITDMSGCWCSVCNEYSDYSTDYCPNCGAKMDEVEE